MPTLNKYDKVEKITLPYRYQAPGSSHGHFELCKRYEDLKREYLELLERTEEANRESWSWERMASGLQDRIDIAEAEIRRLAEAGRYAIYGKPKLSPLDEYDEGEQDSGEATH